MMPRSNRVQNKPRTSIHDLQARQKAGISALQSMLGFADPRALAKAMKSLLEGYMRHRGSSSAYQPHQGAQECERRRRQFKLGEYASAEGDVQ